VARNVALRFVAGDTLSDAIETSQALYQQGILVTLDYLGESVKRAEDTKEVVASYQAALEQLHEHELEASVSLKLTHLGLDISEALCMDNLRQIVQTAYQYSIPVTIDMEDSSYTDVTLDIYRTLREDFPNLGTVIQAYLYRSEADMKALAQEDAHIRLCKGAYLEPPSVAFPDKADVDANYVKLVQDFLGTDSTAYLCIATHDEAMIQASEQFIMQHSIPAERYEFQMLYGIRSQRQQELADAGYKMRVYVPYGEAWYPYFMRRLAERPANVWFIAKNLFRR
jgi:proline dehydrogenase